MFLVVWYLALGWIRQVDSDPECNSSVTEVVGRYGLQIGWFAYERHAHRRVVYYLLELVNLESSSTPSFKASENKKHDQYNTLAILPWGISPRIMVVNTVYTLMIHKCVSPAQTSPLTPDSHIQLLLWHHPMSNELLKLSVTFPPLLPPPNLLLPQSSPS